MLPRHISIWVVTTKSYAHGTIIIGEFIRCLQAALQELGYDAPIVTDPAHIEDWGIALLPNLIPDSEFEAALPEKLILFNLEQVQQDSHWFRHDGYINLLRRYRVWDYSLLNSNALKEHGISNVALCEVGYMPTLTTIATAEKDIDVFFYGSINARRQHIFDQLTARGVHVVASDSSYAAQRDALISRSKIVLNIHFYESKLFEIIRVSFLLANGVCVVSEDGNDYALETPYHGGIAFAPYEELADVCVGLLANTSLRETIAQTGFKRFSQRSQADAVRDALHATFNDGLSQ